MGFRSVRPFRLRNLCDAEVDVDAPEVFLVGENGQGKTNFLEAAYLLAFGSSFRTRREVDLIRRGEPAAAAAGAYADAAGDRTVSVAVHRDGAKEILVDGKAVGDRKTLAQNIPVILFCHGDLEFVTGSPEQRRWFFDQTQSLFDPLHIDALRRYRRVLKSRNVALREKRSDLVSLYDPQLAAAGLEIRRKRVQTADEFNRAFGPIFGRVSEASDELSIVYAPSWGNGDLASVCQVLEATRGRDEALQVTTSGPHRDDFRFLAGERDYARYASTGQLRLLALSLRVAQAAHVQAMTGRRPVLLLDDVLLELDAARRERFLGALPEYEQAFFTFLPDERFHLYLKPRTLVYTVREGALSRWNG
jgi:DNA replication and repair protein RecF